MSTVFAQCADDRTVLRMAGADARAVLQGVVTNDVDRIAADRAVYAALLTPQGKYLADFFLIDDGAGGVLIDAAADQAAALAKRLSMYTLRRDAKVAVCPDLSVGLAWTSDGDMPGVAPDAQVVDDPRTPVLGVRIYGPSGAIVPENAVAAPAGAYTALCVRHGVPTAGAELRENDTYILEAGFERLNGVDFRKGCYVGQEVTARMKHKTDLRKGLVQVRVDGDGVAGTPILCAGKPVGTLFSVADGMGLAHVRHDRVGPDMVAGAARVSVIG